MLGLCSCQQKDPLDVLAAGIRLVTSEQVGSLTFTHIPFPRQVSVRGFRARGAPAARLPRALCFSFLSPCTLPGTVSFLFLCCASSCLEQRIVGEMGRRGALGECLQVLQKGGRETWLSCSLAETQPPQRQHGHSNLPPSGFPKLR